MDFAALWSQPPAPGQDLSLAMRELLQEHPPPRKKGKAAAISTGDDGADEAAHGAVTEDDDASSLPIEMESGTAAKGSGGSGGTAP